MKIMKFLDKKVGDTEYIKYRINLPKKVVEDSFDMECEYIPYGVDHDVFYRLDDKTIEKYLRAFVLDLTLEHVKENWDEFINTCLNKNRIASPLFQRLTNRLIQFFMKDNIL